MTSDPPSDDPGYAAIAKYLRYTLSLPERALRSGTAVVAGAGRERGLLYARAFQNSKSYSVMIRQMLDFLAEDVGGTARREQPNAEAGRGRELCRPQSRR